MVLTTLILVQGMSTPPPDFTTPPGFSLIGDLKRLYQRLWLKTDGNSFDLEQAINYLLIAHASERRAFWPLPESFPLSLQLRKALPVIVEEYRAYTRSRAGEQSMPLLRDLDPDAGKSSNNGIEWRTRFLRLYHHEFAAARLAFPKTFAIIEQDPAIVSAFFSLTRGSHEGASLKWHRGAYRGVLRYHLPIVMPPEASAGRLVSGADGVPAYSALHLQVMHDFETDFEGDAHCAVGAAGGIPRHPALSLHRAPI